MKRYLVEVPDKPKNSGAETPLEWENHIKDAIISGIKNHTNFTPDEIYVIPDAPNTQQSRYMMYIDCKGMITDIAPHSIFIVNHADDGLNGISEAREWVNKNVYDKLFMPVVKCVISNCHNASWSRDLYIWQLACDIQTNTPITQYEDRHSLYELFSVYILHTQHKEWLDDFIKQDIEVDGCPIPYMVELAKVDLLQ